MTFDEFVTDLERRVETQLIERSASSRLNEDLGLDSISMLELLLTLEDMTGRVFPTDLIASLETLGDAYGWVDQLKP